MGGRRARLVRAPRAVLRAPTSTSCCCTRVVGARTPTADEAGALWYPLWDAGFTLGQSVRTVKEALAVADDDLDALTALLDLRARRRRPRPRRRPRRDACATSRHAAATGCSTRSRPRRRSGSIGRADRRDARARPEERRRWPPRRAGAGLGGMGAAGRRSTGDRPARRRGVGRRRRAARRARLSAARRPRPAARRPPRDPRRPRRAPPGHGRPIRPAAAPGPGRGRRARRCGGRRRCSCGASARPARAVVWITRDLWSRLLATEDGSQRPAVDEPRPGRRHRVRDGRIALRPRRDARHRHRAAGGGARGASSACRSIARRSTRLRRARRDRVGRRRARRVHRPARGRDAARSRCSRPSTTSGCSSGCSPSGRSVRARPQRNAYHRFTVDRHSLEAVAECAALLDADVRRVGRRDFDAMAPRAARRDLLLLAALLHDIAKGTARRPLGRGRGLARGGRRAASASTSAGVDDLAWLVRNHLLLAETATRRDLGDEPTISRFAAEVRTSRPQRAAVRCSPSATRARPAPRRGARQGRPGPRAVRQGRRRSHRRRGRRRRPIAATRWARSCGDATSGRSSTRCPRRTRARSRPTSCATTASCCRGELAIEWTRARRRAAGGARSSPPTAPGCSRTVAGALALVGFDIDTAAACSHRRRHGARGVHAAATTSGASCRRRTARRDARPIADALAGAVAVDEQLARPRPPVPTATTARRRPRCARARRPRRVGVGDGGRGARAR